MERPIVLLALHLMFLSAVAVGGFNTTLPELHRYVVDLHGWMTDERFVSLFAIAQATPGPNVIIVSLMGWQVAGIGGAAIATLATCLPTLAIGYSASHLTARFGAAKWYRAFERGVAPFAVGLILTTGVIQIRGVMSDWRAPLLAAATTAFMITTNRSPLIPLAIAAAIGFAGLI